MTNLTGDALSHSTRRAAIETCLIENGVSQMKAEMLSAMMVAADPATAEIERLNCLLKDFGSIEEHVAVKARLAELESLEPAERAWIDGGMP